MARAPTDEQLLAQYLAGDAASFELLVRRHAREVYQFALRFTGGAMGAEDVVQETFLQIHTSARSFDPQRRFKPWLFTIAANKARDLLRRESRRRELPFDAWVDDDRELGARFVDLFSAAPEPVDDGLFLDEKRRIVKEGIDALPPKLRAVLVLAYYHQFPYREIADVLGIPLGTVKSRLHAAVGQFAKYYEQAAKNRTDADDHG